jgi:twitching motility protein PilT
MRLDAILTASQQHGASDILLSAGSPPALRIDGELHPVEAPPSTGEDVAAAIESLMGPRVLTTLGGAAGPLPGAPHPESYEYDMAIVAHERRFRAHAYRADAGLCLALRPIPASVPTPADLHLPAKLVDLARRPRGLLLFTGAAGHGKSTSQASLVDMLNRTSPLHIVTIEDPIEFVHPSQRSVIDQREVGRTTRSFASALRNVLRENPDVILVGEIRDPETAEAALTVAETGHLVMTTLHSNDAVQAVDRIVDMFPGYAQQQVRTQLSMTLLAVVSQRLVRHRAKGRRLAAELLVNTTATAKLIRDGKTEQLYSHLDIDASQGSKSMNRALSELVDAGEILPTEAARHHVVHESAR